MCREKSHQHLSHSHKGCQLLWCELYARAECGESYLWVPVQHVVVSRDENISGFLTGLDLARLLAELFLVAYLLSRQDYIRDTVPQLKSRIFQMFFRAERCVRSLIPKAMNYGD